MILLYFIVFQVLVKTEGRTMAPGLVLELEQIGKLQSNNVILRCVLVNRGKNAIRVNRTFLEGELLRVSFTNESQHTRIRYAGDDVMAYTPLDSNDSVVLESGMVFGVERNFNLKLNTSHVSAQAVCAYKNFEKRGTNSLWEGRLASEKILIR